MRFLNKIKYVVSEHKAEIHFAVGVIGFIGTCVSVYKARPKFEIVLEEHKKAIADYRKAVELSKDNGGNLIYTKSEQRADLAVIWFKTGLGTIKAFWKTLIAGAFSLWSFGKGFSFLKQKINGLVAAYSALATASSSETTSIPFPGDKEEGVKGGDGVLFPHGYVVVFDKSNPNFQPDMADNRFFLKRQEDWLNERLIAKERVYLNEALHDLDFETEDCGQVIGWMHYDDPVKAKANGSDNVICFNAEHIIDENGEHAFVLHLNVDRQPVVGREEV